MLHDGAEPHCLPLKVLVVGHDASRTGAPLVLLRLVQAFPSAEVQVQSILLAGGPLQGDFDTLQDGSAPVLPSWLDWRRLPRRAGVLRGLQDRLLRTWLRRHVPDVDVAYVNTATTGPAVAALQGLGIPVVVHVHELGHWLHTQVREHDLRAALDAQRLIACSEAVERLLVDELEVDPARVTVIHEVPVKVAASASPSAVRAELGIPLTARIIGGSGTVDGRKATDVFLWSCIPLLRSDPAVHAVWLGARNDPGFASWVEHDAVLAGVADRVHLLGGVAQPADVMQCFDVFALTSREDPYPLVMLEAAALSVPIVAFRSAGGAEEFLAEGRGSLVDYGDLAAFTAALGEVLDHRPNEQVERARRAATEQHDPAASAAAVLNVLSAAAGTREARRQVS